MTQTIQQDIMDTVNASGVCNVSLPEEIKANVSLYDNATDTTGKPASLVSILEGIKSGKWEDRIIKLRAMHDDKQKAFKKTLPGFTTSGLFSTRKIDGLIKPSGFIVIDVDAQENSILRENFKEIRQKLTLDRYTYCLFTSCRGNGIAVVLRIDETKHLESFLFLEKYYRETYGLVIDKACKDITRLRFVSYDKDLYLCESADKVQPQVCQREAKKAYAEGNEKELIEFFIKNDVLIGDDTYDCWLKIGFAIANTFGEAGRQYFHALSKASPKYKFDECDKKYTNCLETNQGAVNFGTIVHMAMNQMPLKSAVSDCFMLPGNTKEKPLELDDTQQNETKPSVRFNLTDLGNAKRLVEQYGKRIRYCYAWKKWLVWNGKAWIIDGNGELSRLAKDSVKRIYKESFLIADEEIRKTIAKWAIKSEDEKRINSMVSLAKSEIGVPVSPQELDTDLYLLNCLNGTSDLKTKQLEPHNPQNLITKIIPVKYDPAAKCPQWIEFLETIMNWNYDLISFLQRAIGYSLTGDTSEQCLFLLLGAGANGKSTFLNIVNYLLGDYAQMAIFDTFLAKKEERSVNNDIARMQGKRFVSAIESEGERRLSEVLIKQLTGGDVITARFLFAEFFEFIPQFKIWLACNHKPTIRGTDHAIWRRIRLIPFNVTIPEADRDKHLAEKLRAELPGILAWAVGGCLEWQKSGLQTPDEVKQATNEYQTDMDVIQAFLDDRCFIKVESTDVKTLSGKLYEAYASWCSENGETPLNNRSFGRRLTEKGCITKQSGGKRWLLGVGLTN